MNIFHFFTAVLTVKTGLFTFCEEVSTVMQGFQCALKISERVAYIRKMTLNRQNRRWHSHTRR